MEFRNNSPVSVYDDRILHIDLNEWPEFKTTTELCGEEGLGSFSSGNDNRGDDSCSLPRAPSMAMEGEQENFFPVVAPFFHNHTASLQSNETTDASSSSSSSDDAYSSLEASSLATEIQVRDECKPDALLTQLRQELYEEESCLQLTFDGTACVCHDRFPDFAACLKKRKSPRKKKSKQRGKRLLRNLIHDHSQ